MTTPCSFAPISAPHIHSGLLKITRKDRNVITSLTDTLESLQKDLFDVGSSKLKLFSEETC